MPDDDVDLTTRLTHPVRGDEWCEVETNTGDCGVSHGQRHGQLEN